MKRFILILFAALFLAAAVYLSIPIFESLERGELIQFGLILLSVFFMLIAGFTFISLQLRQKNAMLENRLEMWQKLTYHVNQVGDEIFNRLPIGMIAFDMDFEIKWANPHAKALYSNRVVGKALEDIAPFIYEQIQAQQTRFTYHFNEDVYDVWYRPDFQFLYLFLKTEQFLIEEKYKNSLPTMLIMSLDYIDESIASLPVSEQSSLKGQYLGAIADWANQYEAYLQQLADDRIIAFAKREQLALMIENKFVILDKIRSISGKHNVRVTLSMGVSSWETSYEALGVYAQNAIDLAEKRGGDQVVVNVQNEKIQYFGATQDAQTKNSRVDARIRAQALKQLFEQSDQVIIVGHKRADLDALGAMVGMYSMARSVQSKTHMYAPKEELDPTSLKVMEALMNHNDQAAHWFIERDSISMTDQTLVVLCDTQAKNLIVDETLIVKPDQMVIVDHHRASDDTIDASLTYIEPYASSTVELVTELMMFFDASSNVIMDDFIASMMYSGMIVDTNQFTIRTGPRTFEAAARLKEFGADAARVNQWLRQDMDRVKFINKMIEQAVVIEGKYMIMTYDKLIKDPVLLAQTANQALRINHIEATFAIGQIEEEIVTISARSQGEFNVQIFMEDFGGGGHLSSAAAQIKQTTPSQVKVQIERKIKLEYGGGDEKMKVILLEDVKGRGKKDDIIEVAGGFGQFLLNQNKAMKASDDNLELLNKKQEEKFEAEQRHLALMNKLKSEIDHKHIQIPIQIGKDGKLFGAVTTKQIVEVFEKQHQITLDKKKIEVSSDINSVGIYVVTVHLHKGIDAQFELHIAEKKD